MQLALLRDDTKQKTLSYVPLSELSVSWMNPRRTRPDAIVERLAQRIERNGFEVTRAVWAHRNGNGIEVFAGGTRLEAARRTSLTEIPVWLHDGYSDDELVRLADVDNENDEYHEPVSMIDVWQEYKQLYDMGWTQQRIADAKGVNRAIVAHRLQMAAIDIDWSPFVKKAALNEWQIRELLSLNEYPPYYLASHGIQAILENVTNKKSPTAKDFAAEVSARNELIAYCKQVAESLGDNADRFLKQINWRDDGIRQAKQAEATVRTAIAEEARRRAEELALEAEAARLIECKPGQWWQLGNHLLYCGDTSSDEFRSRASGAAFAFADPPYGAGVGEWDTDFYWQHDWLSSVARLVAVTPGIVSIQRFMQMTTMPYAWSMAAWIDNGMTRGAVGFGSWIYIALFGHGSLYRNAQDHLRVSVKPNNDSAEHFKGRKPLDLIARLVELFTNPGDIVIDPFLGSGTTLEACQLTARRCIGGEIDLDRCVSIIEQWEAQTGEEAGLLHVSDTI